MKNNTDEIIVKFDQVTKQYGDLVVLDKLNLDIKKNEMVSIIGPSGSGKTTVLRVLMTLEKINGGVIHLDGEPLTHMDNNGSLIEANEKYLRERIYLNTFEKILITIKSVLIFIFIPLMNYQYQKIRGSLPNENL